MTRKVRRENEGLEGFFTMKEMKIAFEKGFGGKGYMRDVEF